MAGSIQKTLFSPIGKEYCLYFYYTSVIAFIFFLLASIGGLYQVFNGSLSIFTYLIGLLSPALLYFNNRLLYSMCV
jgi:hypothetical protein